MILHVFYYDKFDRDYIEKINSIYDENDHLFFIYGVENNASLRKITAKNVVFSSSFSSKKEWMNYLSTKIDIADKVIIHSLFSRNIMWVLYKKMKKNSHKYFWMIWGGDLYNAYWNRYKSLSNILREHIRKKIIRKIPAVGYIKGDYDFLISHYKTDAKFYLASYTYDFFDIEEKKDIFTILIGNSASKSCRYEQALDKLASILNKDDEFKIMCILSYPNDDAYIKQISTYGHKLFGNKFIPITEFLPYEKYVELLAKTDVAIFNHNRQQALGNIASLVYLGKKVFISKENACINYFEDMGAIVYEVGSMNRESLFIPLSIEQKQKNKNCILDFYSDKKFKERWSLIFEEDKK